MGEEEAECADYSSFVAEIRTELVEFIDANVPTQDEIEAHTKKLLDNFDRMGVEETKKADHLISEVYMIQDVGANAVLRRFQVFAEISESVGHGYCDPACAPRQVMTDRRGNKTVTVDIKLRRSIYEDDPLSFPGGDRDASKDDIAFNKCTGDNATYRTYRDLVHEAGHAFGIAYGSTLQDQDQHHSLISDSVMSYVGGTENNCSPHPLDVMAVYAIYQVTR